MVPRESSGFGRVGLVVIGLSRFLIGFLYDFDRILYVFDMIRF